MSTTLSAPSNGVDAHRGKRPNSALIVLYLSLGGLSFAVLQSMVAPALSTIGKDLNASTSSVSWILTAYLLSASVLTPILGRLGDMVGKRRILIVVLSVLLIGTVLAALAPNLAVLIIARALQGAAGAVMPLSIGIVRDELPKERVSTTIGLLSAIFGIGAGVGIVAAGPIVQNLDWQWLFWLPAVLIVVALLGVIFGMPESPVRKPGRLDLAGTAVLTVALVSILLAVSEGEDLGLGLAADRRTARRRRDRTGRLRAGRAAREGAADRRAPLPHPRRLDRARRRPDPGLRDGSGRSCSSPPCCSCRRSSATASAGRSPRPVCSCCRPSARWSCSARSPAR